MAGLLAREKIRPLLEDLLSNERKEADCLQEVFLWVTIVRQLTEGQARRSREGRRLGG